MFTDWYKPPGRAGRQYLRPDESNARNAVEQSGRVDQRLQCQARHLLQVTCKVGRERVATTWFCFHSGVHLASGLGHCTRIVEVDLDDCPDMRAPSANAESGTDGDQHCR